MSGKSKNKNNKSNKWMICLLISIPMTFGLIKILEYKNEILFWTYMGIGGISALIMRWAGNTDNKSKFLKIIQYIALTCAITLFSWGIWNYLFRRIKNETMKIVKGDLIKLAIDVEFDFGLGRSSSILSTNPKHSAAAVSPTCCKRTARFSPDLAFPLSLTITQSP